MSSSINSSHRLCNLNRYNKQLPVLHRRKLAQMEISLTYLRSLWVPQNTKTTRNNYSQETIFKKILTVGSNLSPMILPILLQSIRNNKYSKLIVIALRLLTTQSSNRSSSMRSLKPLGTLRIITILKVDPLSFQIIALI